MFQESFNAAEILTQNILNQSISTSKADKDITFLSAALFFDENGMPYSYTTWEMESASSPLQ